MFYVGGTAGKYLFRGAREPALGTITQSTASVVSINAMNSTAYPLNNAVAINANFVHGLGHTPSYLRAVLLCTTTDPGSGIVAGTEIGAECFMVSAFVDADIMGPFVVVGCDATKIYITNYAAIAPDILIQWLGNQFAPTSLANFSVKIYWQ